MENQCSESKNFQFIVSSFPTFSRSLLGHGVSLLHPHRVNLFTFNSSRDFSMHEIEIKYRLFNHLLSIVSRFDIKHGPDLIAHLPQPPSYTGHKEDEGGKWSELVLGMESQSSPHLLLGPIIDRSVLLAFCLSIHLPMPRSDRVL